MEYSIDVARRDFVRNLTDIKNIVEALDIAERFKEDVKR